MEESLSPVVPSTGRNPGTPRDRSTTRHSEAKPAPSALKRYKDARSQLRNPLRFNDGKALASYIGIIPSEHSSGGRQRLGAMSKQGNAPLRYLWCEAAMHAVERDPELKRFYRRKLVQKELGKARVAAARKLGIRLWIMMRDQIDYQEFCRRGKARQESGSVRAGMPDRNSGPAAE